MYRLLPHLAATPARVAAVLLAVFAIAFAAPSLFAAAAPAQTIEITKFAY
jgi:hypothetical protein